METVKLSKEFGFEDYAPVTELNLTLSDLKGNDIIEVSDILQAQGHISVQPSLDTKVHAALAARSIGRPVEYINALPAPDFMKVCQKVQSFLLA